MQHLQTCYCKGCGIAVASADPDRRQVGLEIWHAPCLKKKREKDEEDKTKLLKQTAYKA